MKLKAIFANTDGALVPTQFDNARLTLETLDKQVLVATTGVQRGTPGTFVYRVNDDSSVAIKIVKQGVTRNDVTAIIEGLSPGDRIVTNGTDKLRDGAHVDIASDAPVGGSAQGKGAPKNTGRGKPGDPSTHRGESTGH